jgi:ubiquinone/menaquinone biosynthesis C-methylase UbiE
MGMIEAGLRRAAYGAASTARVGWYTMHYVAGRRIVGPLTGPGEVPRPYRFPAPDMTELTASFRELFQREGRDIAAGVYKMPRDLRRLPNPVRALRDSRRYMEEARAVSRRAHQKGGGVEVRAFAEEGGLKGVPGYYHQNFHFQSDGWLSDRSAAVYDTQVETLFTGAADAMRRRALPFLRAEVDRLAGEGQPEEDVVFLDVACGTGRLLAEVADNFPALQRHAVDLSPPYLDAARRAAGEGTAYTIAPAERLPFADGSVDVACTVYLFHELPPKVRRQVAAEIARVLRPGGLYLHTDSVQYGDTGMDVLLETFPRAFHEPYYDSYCQEELGALFGAAGLAPEGQEVAFLSKVSAFRKGEDARG